jgi:trimethylamine:corrinoid methyltransferase-like protein
MPRVSSRRRKRGRGATDLPVATPSTRRKIPAYELLDEESLVSLENHAEWLLTEIGIEIVF